MQKKNKKTKRKSRNMRIKIPDKIRLAIIGILTIIFIFLLISFANAYQKPTTTQIRVTTIEYNQALDYDYIAYLNESLIYEGKNMLLSGEGTIFKYITNSLNGTFIYTLSTSKKSDTTVSYTITATIETNFWNKTYTIKPESIVNFSGTTSALIEEFPIDYIFYENITSQIEEETGVTISDPTLVIKTDILLTINSDGQRIVRTFTPTLRVALKKPTIDIRENLDNKDSGEIIKTEDIFNQDVVDERNKWGASSLIFLIILAIVTSATKSSEELTETGRINKKIMKKYKEWIVYIDKEPKKAKAEIIKVNSFEDLIKISEELGKPILHFSKKYDSHDYYVLEESTIYQYSLSNVLWEKKQKK
jgi:hypothetical protein